MVASRTCLRDDVACLAVSEGLVPAVLSRLGVSGPALRTAIADRRHPAG